MDIHFLLGAANMENDKIILKCILLVILVADDEPRAVSQESAKLCQHWTSMLSGKCFVQQSRVQTTMSFPTIYYPTAVTAESDQTGTEAVDIFIVPLPIVENWFYQVPL